jgi:hypothetical protein
MWSTAAGAAHRMVAVRHWHCDGGVPVREHKLAGHKLKYRNRFAPGYGN